MTIKTRNWSMVIWPDRSPDDWIDRLENICIANGIRAAVSPIHDRDFWTPQDEAENRNHMSGNAKPAHYHVILRYPGGPTTQNNIECLMESLNGTIEPITGAGSLASMYAYLTHKYQKTKAQYDEDDILLLNGFDKLDVKCSQTKRERVNTFKKICAIIKNRHFDNIIALINYLDANDMDVELAYIEAYTNKVTPMLNAQRKQNERDNSIF